MTSNRLHLKPLPMNGDLREITTDLDKFRELVQRFAELESAYDSEDRDNAIAQMVVLEKSTKAA